jgi:Phosphotransferase enzyme family
MTLLHSAEAGLAAGPQLGRVAEALDAHAMSGRLRAALGEPGRRGAHVLDAKYEPGVRCTVLYRVGNRLVRGDLLEEWEPARSFPGCGGGRRPVVAPGLELSCFPDDPDLPALAQVTDPARLRTALQPGLPGAPGQVAGCRASLLRYRPGKRATFAVTVRRRPGRTGADAAQYVLKAYHDARKAAAVAAEAALLGATVDPRALLRLAPVRAHLPHLAVVVQARVSGTPLEDVIRVPGPHAVDALGRAATALAALHRQPVVSERRRVVAAELARFRTRAARVGGVDPAAGAVLDHLAARLVASGAEVPAGAGGLVHGDCKPSQFLLGRDGRVVLLDLDSCGRADPAGDVGTFLATLRQHTAQQVLARRATGGSVRARAALAEAFLTGYLDAAAAGDREQLRRRIRWYEAVALERKALRTYARAPGSPLTRVLVDEGHRCLDRLGGTA